MKCTHHLIKVRCLVLNMQILLEEDKLHVVREIFRIFFFSSVHVNQRLDNG